MVIHTPINSFDEAVEWIEKSPQETREKIVFLYKRNWINCDALYEAIYQIKKTYPEFRPDKQLITPIPTPKYFYQVQMVQEAHAVVAPKISVVIPTRRRPAALTSSLKSLCQQNLSVSDFEVIIVEDGNDEATADRIRQISAEYPGVNIRYVQVSRTSTFFHAGLIRNIGCEYAYGEILVFLDGDIVAPSGLLDDILKSHDDFDVIQYPRRHVSPDSKAIELSNYWTSFYSDTRAWSKRPLFWKYISTSCLSVKRHYFEECGGFSKDFTSYGFEDTYLGYQLSYLTHRWKIGALWVDHLLQAYEDPIAIQSPIKKKNSLSSSAKTFFILTKDVDFYVEFFPLLGQHPNFRWLITKTCAVVKIHWILFLIFNVVNIISKPWLLKKIWDLEVVQPVSRFILMPALDILGYYVYRPFGLYIKRPVGLYVSRPFGLYVKKPFGLYVSKPFGLYIKRPFGLYVSKPFGLYVKRPFGIYIKKNFGQIVLGNIWVLLHPISWCKKKTPLIYKILIRPFEKAYYFVQFQWRKRVKKETEIR